MASSPIPPRWTGHVAALHWVMPPEAQQLVADQLTDIVRDRSSSLGIGFLVSFVIAVWSANAGTSALISALNVAYGEHEKRGVLRYYGGTPLLTLSSAICGGLALLRCSAPSSTPRWSARPGARPPAGPTGRRLLLHRAGEARDVVLDEEGVEDHHRQGAQQRRRHE